MSEDRLQTREAMLFELQAEKHNHRRDNEYLVGQVNKLTSENAELAVDLRATMEREEKAHAEIERLRAALKPFANAGKLTLDQPREAGIVAIGELTVGDLRRAYEAIDPNAHRR